MPLPRSFYFLRHGETDWNKAGRLQGWTDIPLNENGVKQARAAVEKLSALEIHRIVTSPLARAYDTAKIINDALKKPLAVDGRLKERNYGILEGMDAESADALRDAVALVPGAVIEENGYPCVEGAEPYEAFKDRVITSIAENLEGGARENILFVAHGGVYRALCRRLALRVGQSPNVKPFLFEKRPDIWVLLDV